MGQDVLGANPFPVGAIALVGFGITLVAVVMVVHLFLVLWAVLFICKLGAAGVRTWSFGLLWQGRLPPAGK